MHSGPIVLAACVAAFAASGCAAEEIDVAKSSPRIQGIIEQQLGASIGSMSCPETVKVEAKATFTCVVTGRDGTRGIATITQTDGKGTISVRAPFLPATVAERSVQADLRRRAPRATVVCPEIIVLKAGGTFECKANLGEINATVIATQTNAKGSFTYSLKST